MDQQEMKVEKTDEVWYKMSVVKGHDAAVRRNQK